VNAHADFVTDVTTARPRAERSNRAARELSEPILQPLSSDSDVRHFRILLGVVGAAALAIAVLLAYAYLEHRLVYQVVGVAGLGVIGLGMLIGQRFVGPATIGRAVVITSVGLLLFILALVMAGNARPTLSLTTLVAVLIAVPYVERRTLRWLSAGAFGVAAVIAVQYALTPDEGTRSTSEALLRFLGVCINVAIALFAISHVSGRLSSAAQRYRNLFQRVPVGMYRTTPDGRFLDANQAFASLFGFDDASRLATLTAADLYADPADRLQFRNTVERDGIARSIDYRARRADGSIVWVRDSAMLVRDGVGRPLYYEGIIEDVTERKHQEQRLHQRASVDSLTGLANRAVLLEHLEEVLVEASPSEPVALLFVDLDGFKQVNDRFGHAVGDGVLVDAGRRLHAATRDTDVTARFGGDEFAVVLEVPTGRTIAEAVARRIVAAFDEPFSLANEMIRLGASVGIAMAERPMSPAELVTRADEAMYQAKAGAKVAIFEN
jgi:diguanylate cyclase (GGDEF)-like protein/PAS domain S-box-containing protein